MYVIQFFMRPLAKPVFERMVGGCPRVRCFTDVNYRVFVSSDRRSDRHEVLTAPWGPHGRPGAVDLLGFWSVRTEPDRVVSTSFAEDRVCALPAPAEPSPPRRFALFPALADGDFQGLALGAAHGATEAEPFELVQA